jgi:hypothetical protein
VRHHLRYLRGVVLEIRQVHALLQAPWLRPGQVQPQGRRRLLLLPHPDQKWAAAAHSIIFLPVHRIVDRTTTTTPRIYIFAFDVANNEIRNLISYVHSSTSTRWW